MGTILAQGDFLESEIEAIRSAANKVGQAVDFVGSAEEARSWLGRQVPSLILTLGVGQEASQVTTLARTELSTPHVAVIAVSEELGNRAFSAAMSWGADDLLGREPGLPGLLPRLRAAVSGQGRSFSPKRGMALLADASPVRQVAFRRTLEGAGFRVRCIDHRDQLEAAAADLRTALWVVSTNFVEEPEQLLLRARQSGVVAKAVLVADGDQFSRLSAATQDEGCRVLRGSAPADHLVFLANEMSRPDLLNQREAPRALYSTVVEFVDAADGRVELGYSYNVSDRGLYVRTMAPPESELVRIALEVPGVSERLELDGHLAWRKPFGADAQATAPPGFGMKLVGPEHALETWQSALAPGAG